ERLQASNDGVELVARRLLELHVLVVTEGDEPSYHALDERWIILLGRHPGPAADQLLQQVRRDVRDVRQTGLQVAVSLVQAAHDAVDMLGDVPRSFIEQVSDLETKHGLQHLLDAPRGLRELTNRLSPRQVRQRLFVDGLDLLNQAMLELAVLHPE